MVKSYKLFVESKHMYYETKTCLIFKMSSFVSGLAITKQRGTSFTLYLSFIPSVPFLALRQAPLSEQ